MIIKVDPKTRTILINGVKIHIPRPPNSVDGWVKHFEKGKLSDKSVRKLIPTVENEMNLKPMFQVDKELIELSIILKALKKYIEN